VDAGWQAPASGAVVPEVSPAGDFRVHGVVMAGRRGQPPNRRFIPAGYWKQHRNRQGILHQGVRQWSPAPLDTVPGPGAEL